MMRLQIITALLCFQSNTTIILDVQTRELVFKAWPRTDNSRDINVCRQLSGDMFKLSVRTGTYDYILNQLQTFEVTQYIELKIQCADVVDKCASAFKATSAIYSLEFQEAKQLIQEAASNLRRLDFNRKACVLNTAILYGQNVTLATGVKSNGFKVTGTPKYCKYPTDSMATIMANNPADRKAVFSLFAYPNFTMTTSLYSVSPTFLVQYGAYACIAMSTPELVAWCNNMVLTFAQSSFGYVNMEYSIPSLIPNRDGTMTRIANYSMVLQSNQVKDGLQTNLDCYSNQELIIFQNTLQLRNSLNNAMVHCNQPMDTFIGISYDKMITRISFQQNKDFRTGQVYILDFITQSQVLNNTQEWLTCNISTNESFCNEVLNKRNTISKYILNAQQLLYSNDEIIKIIPLSPIMKTSCYSDAFAEIMETQACITLTNICLNDVATTKQFSYSFGNNGSYSQNLLNISSQQQFPNLDNKYCVNYDFNDTMITLLTDIYSDTVVTGVLTIGEYSIPISSVVDASQIKDVNNIEWFVVGMVIFTIILVGFSIQKPWI
ncbi:Conserved_hypothetical protein [Hexamita inflata]|uniref:Uncharacterized protein n=1 Tax=Hexamita inflata TaxID=28002 RepID=A0AA86V593_9EUKA|nr:Conserved hypothetical protein [Hexamita inflata]